MTEENISGPSSNGEHCELKDCDLNSEISHKIHTSNCTSQELLLLINENEFVLTFEQAASFSVLFLGIA